ncbi:MAG: VCBS repeat-containing protein [Candidatus Krumholzibacteriota bacterium]|nr:VCBS repeat-containing protein [Candidatus Krumholzibacteriota bacterium]
MSTCRRKHEEGFTLIEIVMSILVLGFVLIAVSGIFILYQKGSAKTTDHAEAQQNTRIALDFITGRLRQAGSQTDYFRGQLPVVHAGPYQIAINADIDNGQTIDGQAPLAALNRAVAQHTVPASGTPIYTPADNYDSDAETVVFTVDSNADGLIDAADRGDDPVEGGNNKNLFVLKQYVYGFNGSGVNEVRESDLAKVRGPNLTATWTIPQPMFQYWYDHDENPATPDLLWGDGNADGELSDSEALAVTEMPANMLANIRKVRITVISESERYEKQYETNGGFLDVTMTSEVFVRNATRTSAMISGMVYHDADKDGALDPGETGIPNVEIRIAGQGSNVLSDNFGRYFFPLPAGDYSVQEVDPMGYTSTTANIVSVTLASGQTKSVNFGDVSTTPSGVIEGYVYEDIDQDALMDIGEEGIAGVLVSLDTGAETYTNDRGYYSFVARQGNYTVVETDPTGFASTTPNSGAASIVAQDDTVRIDFGDFAGPVTGVLEGYVFLDVNEDGVRNAGEEGLPNVMMTMSSGDTTLTNANGYYRFNLAPEIYKITETDPAGYTSTTVNTYENIKITADTTVVRDFGDVLENRQDFVEIHISNTDRVLSVSTANLDEDDKRDTDIVLGTALVGGIGNMLVFHNKWESSTTPVTELFDSDPSYRRDAGYNINAMDVFDYSGDGTPDVISGLDVGTDPNLQFWLTEAEGVLSTSPEVVYHAGGFNEVMDVKLVDLDRDGNLDMLVGLKSSFGVYKGALVVYRGFGGNNFMPVSMITEAGSEGDLQLGDVWAVGSGDIDGDGDQDVIIGTHRTEYTGCIDIFLNAGEASGVLEWRARYETFGAVNDLMVIDMMEDDARDPDIIIGSSIAANAGFVMLWSNTGGVFGWADTTGYAFGPETVPNLPDDWVDAHGEALCLAALALNNDIFPDIAYGTRRSSLLYLGDIYVLPSYGTLPDGGLKVNTSDMGEIIAIGVADFNKDSRPDLVVGTRSSATQGRLIAYFGREI